MLNVHSLAEQVERKLKDEIISGQLIPGQRIDLKAYAAAWKISVTPIREAVKQLEAQSFVKIQPRRGVFVAELDAKAIEDIFNLRIALECLAIELATPVVPDDEIREALELYRSAKSATNDDSRSALLPKIDNLIHNIAMRHCDNAHLIRTLVGLRDVISWSQGTIIRRLVRPYDETLHEHIRIAEAMCSRDSDRARQAMKTHLANSLRRIQEQAREAGHSHSKSPLQKVGT